MRTNAFIYCVSFTYRESGSETDSREDFDGTAASQAFLRHRHDLVAVVGSALVNHLATKELVPESTTRRILIPGLSHTERNSAIVDAIEARIHTNPRVFHALVSLLQGDIMLQTFARRLMDSYRKSTQSSY